MKANDENKPRQTKAAPFCWQHKKALRMIRDVLKKKRGSIPTAIALYVTLTELESDANGKPFTARVSKIARRAGLAYSTAFEYLKLLESLKLIAIKRRAVKGTKERFPNTYTVLPPSPFSGEGSPLNAERFEESLNSEKHFSKEKSTRHFLRKVTPFPFIEGEEFLSETQRNALHFYNRNLSPRGWLPVTKLTDEVWKLLDCDPCGPEAIIELVKGVLSNSPDVLIPSRRTLVRLCWENY